MVRGPGLSDRRSRCERRVGCWQEAKRSSPRRPRSGVPSAGSSEKRRRINQNYRLSMLPGKMRHARSLRSFRNRPTCLPDRRRRSHGILTAQNQCFRRSRLRAPLHRHLSPHLTCSFVVPAVWYLDSTGCHVRCLSKPIPQQSTPPWKHCGLTRGGSLSFSRQNLPRTSPFFAGQSRPCHNMLTKAAMPNDSKTYREIK